MEPLAILSLTSSIAQLVEFIRCVVSDGRQISRLGSTTEHTHIQALVKDVNTLSYAVNEKYHPTSAVRSQDEADLRKLGEATCEVSNELIEMLEGLQIQSPDNSRKRKRDVLWTSMKTLLKKGDIQKLQQRVTMLQQQLHLRLTWAMTQPSVHSIVRRKMLESLMFLEIFDRQDSIRACYENTFEWIFDQDATGFATWAQSQSGIFWVTGKPGSGKSTLMKYLSNHKESRRLLEGWAAEDKLVTARHYFWVAGTTTQKSQSGLLRSLLFQILQESPEIAPIVAPQRFLDKDAVQHPWTMSELLETIQKVASLDDLPLKFCVFVDGLDEYDGEHGDLVRLLSDLGASPRFKMALSSRQWNVFSEKYMRLPPEHKIVMQEKTRQDILTYVQGSLEADAQYRELQDGPKAGIDLVEDITKKSQGVFLWVFLVIRSLLNGLTNGDDLDILRQRVSEYPESLDGYFGRMFDSTEKVYRQQMGRILLAAIHANGGLPLRLLDDIPTEMRNQDYDIHMPVQQVQPAWQDDERAVVRAKKLLDARCRDLLEITIDKIQFLHLTVRDFLATQDMYAMLVHRAGPHFDPVVSLARVTLAMIKTHKKGPSHHLSQLLSYERRTAEHTWWRSNSEFFENLEKTVEFWQRDGLEQPFDFCGKFHGFAYYPDPKCASDNSSFLDVTQTQDWLASVTADEVTTILGRGIPFSTLNFRITCHCWLAYRSASLFDRILLVGGHDMTVADSQFNPSYMLIARFRGDEANSNERQYAFVRIAQALLAQWDACANIKALLSSVSPPLRTPETSSPAAQGGAQRRGDDAFKCTAKYRCFKCTSILAERIDTCRTPEGYQEMTKIDGGRSIRLLDTALREHLFRVNEQRGWMPPPWSENSRYYTFNASRASYSAL